MITAMIRTESQLKKMNPSLQDAISFLLKNPHKKVPLIYQYLHNPTKELVIDCDNRVGTITNVRRNKIGDIVGDVTINDILKIASNFVGEVDNMAASFHEDSKRIEIDAFIIYDKVAKNEIRVNRENQQNKIGALSKVGEIPIMSQNSAETMREISEKLMKEYEIMVNEQNNNSQKEE